MIGAVCGAVAVVVISLAFLNVIRSMQRQHARERDLILNQLLNATGHTWEPPPADVRMPPPEPEPREYQALPEQYTA